MLIPDAYAGKVELTTYYPAPFGEYRQLQATGADTSNSNIALQARGSAGTGLVVTNANQVGIGTAVPGATLDVNGELRIAATTLACTAAAAGAIRYNSDTNAIEACLQTSTTPTVIWGWTSTVGRGSGPKAYGATFITQTNNNYGSWTNIGLGIAVTPSSSSSKLLINANVAVAKGASGFCQMGLFRDKIALAAPYSSWDPV